ncbi:MAG: hypothetical protein ORN49_04015 [Rhodobacteraceae bacterium]|nr:hypothetical protein [Paracoccaceae bacterium]
MKMIVRTDARASRHAVLRPKALACPVPAEDLDTDYCAFDRMRFGLPAPPTHGRV